MRRVGAAIFILFAATAAAPAHTHRCDAHRAYLRTRSVLVFKHHGAGDDGAGNPVTVYLACARPNGAPRVLARDAGAGGEYPGNYILLRARVAGRYAAAWEEDGLGDAAVCGKVQGSPCPTPSDQVTVLDPAHRRVAHFATDAPRVTGPHQPLFLSSAGAVAWVSGRGLYATRSAPAGARGLRGNPQLVASGSVSSVTLNGFTLSWTSGGQSHTTTLPPV